LKRQPSSGSVITDSAAAMQTGPSGSRLVANGRKEVMGRRFAAVAVAVLAGSVLAPSASADPAVNTTVPLNFVTSSQCPADTGGEQVAFEGAMHLTYSFNSNPPGGFREQFHANVHLLGVGLTTGDRYIFAAGDTITGIYPSGRGAVVSVTGRVQEIHAGDATPGDDFSIRMVLSPGGFNADREGCA
jgi:hypothetical protein